MEIRCWREQALPTLLATAPDTGLPMLPYFDIEMIPGHRDLTLEGNEPVFVPAAADFRFVVAEEVDAFPLGCLAGKLLDLHLASRGFSRGRCFRLRSEGATRTQSQYCETGKPRKKAEAHVATCPASDGNTTWKQAPRKKRPSLWRSRCTVTDPETQP